MMSQAKEPGFPLRLTRAQRKVIAGLLPIFRPRLLLDQANQRVVQFTLDQIESIATTCLQAIPKAATGMERNSLEHVVVFAKQAIEKYGKSKIHRIPTAQRLFQFRISLRGITPRIWRRIQVKDCTLDRLHEHIQTGMGWTNSHLHSFRVNDQLYGDPMLLEGNFEELDYEDSTCTRLSEILQNSGDRFRFDYEYDLGDRWKHNVLFEGCVRAEKGTRYPVCLEGERACPPEDVGGSTGYAEYLETLNNPDDEQWEESSEWRGPCRPEQFDAGVATKRMRRGLPNWREEEWI